MPPGTRILGMDDDRDQRDDDADDEQHRVLAVIRPLSAYRDPCTSTDPLSVRLCTGRRARELCRGPATASSNIACGGTVGSPRPTCALGNSAVQRQRVLFWHATRIAQGRPGHRLGVGGVDRWHRREPELSNELDCPGWRRRHSAYRDDVAVERSSPNNVREHSGGTPMTEQAAIVPTPKPTSGGGTGRREGAEGDRRTAKRMRGLMLLIAAGFSCVVRRSTRISEPHGEGCPCRQRHEE